MDGAQLIVLALLVAAFAAGWWAGRDRGEGEQAAVAPGDDDARDLVHEGERALDDAVVAASAALAVSTAGDEAAIEATLSILDEATGALPPIEARLRERFGANHPLTEEFSDCSAATSLMAESLPGAGDAGTEPFRGIDRAARDALLRYRRAERPVSPLL